MPAWPAPIQPMVIQEELVKNPEYVLMFLQRPFLKKKKDVFPLRFTVKVYNTNLLKKKKSPQHLTENEQNICHQQLPNI